MALAIATNTGALMAAASASSVNKDMETSMERLSTGKRINSAKDDAAGVAIASRLSSEIRGTNQAIRNAMDGQGMLNTAEGAHKEIENILQRMRELAVQAANDTNGALDRSNLQIEVDQLTTEIDRIAATTTWAGIMLLDGASPNSSDLATSHTDKASFTFQVGSGTAAQTGITATLGSVSAAALGLSGPNTVPSVQTTINAAGTEGSLTLTAQTDDSNTFTLGGEWNAGDTYTAEINGVAVTITATDADGYSNDMDGLARQFADAIESAVLLPANEIPLSNITVSRTGTDVTVALGAAGGSFTLNNTSIASDTGSDASITLATNNKITLADATYEATVAFSVDINGKTFTVTNGTDFGTGTAFSESDGGAAAALAAKINGDSDFQDANITATSSAGSVTLEQKLVPSGLAVTSGAAASTLTESSGTFTVGGTVTAGDTFSLVIEGTQVQTSIAAGDQYTDDIAGAAAQIAQAIKDAGIENVNVTNITATGFKLEKSNSVIVDSLDNARSAIQNIDAAIQTVNAQRANLGAISNRLDNTVANLTNVSINLEAGKGRIEDADFAAESTSLAKSQILQQASTAMLAQANASKQNVLSLLQG
ncbi:MAG: hypothetical protein JJ868_12200 [Shimia sp.]|uniref:flagellin N-terminal helical domain-containing protein n=1 Tax=Shimia sp. TaxID=1954381 RepID=UPI001B19D3C5|nr:flagellin [Shimia sp.]MBO6898125.1 hypothetical protein [Shimia sp.]